MADADATIATWRTAQETGQIERTLDCLTEDATFISPLTDAFRFRGRRQIVDVLEAATGLIEGIHFHTEVGSADTRVLVYAATVRGIAVEEAQLLRLDDGLIREVTFFGRPLPALTAVMTGIAGPMLRGQGRPNLGRAITAATAPLAAMTRLGEKRIVPLADPNRRR